MSNLDKEFSEMIEESAKGSLVLILGQMTSTLISALGVIVVARMLGSSSYGLISIALIPINVASLLINNGITTALTNFIAEDRHNNAGKNISKIVTSGFIINIAIGTLTSLGLYLSANYLSNNIFLRPELIPLIKILSITTLARALLNSASSVIIGFERMEHSNIIKIFYSILQSTIGPILVFLGYGLVGAAYGKSTPILIAGILGIILVRINLQKIKWSNLDTSYFKPIIEYSTPIFASTILSGLFLQTLNFILPLYVSPSVIGNYTAAMNFNVLIGFILTPIGTAMFPLLSKLNPEDNVFQNVYNNIIKYEAIVAYPMTAAVVALSSRMVSILYGPDYQSAILYVQIIMLNYLFLGLGSTVNGILLKSQRRTNVNLRLTLIYLLIGVPSGFFLIPRYGVLGFLATTILAPKLGLVYSTYWIRENFGITLDIKLTGKIALSTILSYIACTTTLRFISSNIWVELFLGGGTLAIIYMVSILITGALTKKNLIDIKRITDKNILGKNLGGPILKLLIRIAKI